MLLPQDTRREAYSLLLVVFVLCAVVTWMRTATVKETYRFVQQEKEFHHLEQEIQGARIRWLQLTAPKRLESLARALQLGPPRNDQILRYEASLNSP